MPKKRRLLPIAALLLAAVLLLFFAFILADANHDCAGAGCPVCRQIAGCLRLLQSGAAALRAVVLPAKAAFLLCLCAIWRIERRVDSLVTKKVKLSI